MSEWWFNAVSATELFLCDGNPLKLFDGQRIKQIHF